MAPVTNDLNGHFSCLKPF